MSPALLLALLLQTGDVVPPPPDAPACRKPVLADHAAVSKDELAEAADAVQGYVDCMRSFTGAQTQLANSLMAKARSHA